MIHAMGAPGETAGDEHPGASQDIAMEFSQGVDLMHPP